MTACFTGRLVYFFCIRKERKTGKHCLHNVLIYCSLLLNPITEEKTSEWIHPILRDSYLSICHCFILKLWSPNFFIDEILHKAFCGSHSYIPWPIFIALNADLYMVSPPSTFFIWYQWIKKSASKFQSYIYIYISMRLSFGTHYTSAQTVH